MRSDLAGDRQKLLEFKSIESIGVEVTTGGEKWFMCGIYKPPNMPDEKFYTDFSQTVDKILTKYDKYMFIGDFNFNMLKCDKNVMINDICDIFNLKNIIKKATCFTKNAKATLLDLILLNQDCDLKKSV